MEDVRHLPGEGLDVPDVPQSVLGVGVEAERSRRREVVDHAWASRRTSATARLSPLAAVGGTMWAESPARKRFAVLHRFGDEAAHRRHRLLADRPFVQVPVVVGVEAAPQLRPDCSSLQRRGPRRAAPGGRGGSARSSGSCAARSRRGGWRRSAPRSSPAARRRGTRARRTDRSASRSSAPSRESTAGETPWKPSQPAIASQLELAWLAVMPIARSAAASALELGKLDVGGLEVDRRPARLERRDQVLDHLLLPVHPRPRRRRPARPSAGGGAGRRTEPRKRCGRSPRAAAARRPRARSSRSTVPCSSSPARIPTFDVFAVTQLQHPALDPLSLAAASREASPPGPAPTMPTCVRVMRSERGTDPTACADTLLRLAPLLSESHRCMPRHAPDAQPRAVRDLLVAEGQSGQARRAPRSPRQRLVTIFGRRSARRADRRAVRRPAATCELGRLRIDVAAGVRRAASSRCGPSRSTRRSSSHRGPGAPTCARSTRRTGAAPTSGPTGAGWRGSRRSWARRCR